MKNKGFFYLLAFMALPLMVGLACSGGSTPAASQPAVLQPVASQTVEQTPVETQAPSGEYTTFTDQNKYYSIEVPTGWKHTLTSDKQNNEYYIDTFEAPDQNALVENIVYDIGKAFTGSSNGRVALYLLNTFYSKTGQEGDIRVSDDSIQQDGSERLTWTSKGGGYSGISFFEVRNKTTFLMFTVEWGNNYKDQYFDTLDHVVSSYSTP